jgi:hypothetical protein
MRGFSNEIGTIANHFGGQFANLVGFMICSMMENNPRARGIDILTWKFQG